MASISPPTLVEHKAMRFLICDAPSDHNLPLYIKVRDPHGTRDSDSVVGSRGWPLHRLGPNASSHAALRSSSNAVLRAESHRPNPFRVSSSPLSMSPSRFQEFKKHNVTDVVRVSNPTYGTQPLADAHIAVHVRGQPLSRSGSATACARHGGRTSLPSRR